MAAVVGGCTAGPSAPSAATCDGSETLFINCSGCHDGTQPGEGGLDLRSPDAQVAALVGRVARSDKCASTGRVLLEPDGTGLFLDKLGPAPPCGDRMPQGARPFTDDEIACVETWIADLVATSP